MICLYYFNVKFIKRAEGFKSSIFSLSFPSVLLLGTQESIYRFISFLFGLYHGLSRNYHPCYRSYYLVLSCDWAEVGNGSSRSKYFPLSAPGCRMGNCWRWVERKDFLRLSFFLLFFPCSCGSRLLSLATLWDRSSILQTEVAHIKWTSQISLVLLRCSSSSSIPPAASPPFPASSLTNRASLCHPKSHWSHIRAWHVLNLPWPSVSRVHLSSGVMLSLYPWLKDPSLGWVPNKSLRGLFTPQPRCLQPIPDVCSSFLPGENMFKLETGGGCTLLVVWKWSSSRFATPYQPDPRLEVFTLDQLHVSGSF